TVGAVSDTSALLLADDGNTRLHFAPAANFNGGSSAALTVRAWDRTSGVAGTKVDASSNGGSTAFSSATDAVDVTVTAVNDAPSITSDGGGASAARSVAENTSAVTTVAASDVDTGATLTYSIAGGADAARFTINPSSGALAFATAPDLEAPSDAGADNVYDVTVQVSDGSLIDTQAIAVSVTNANETPVNTVPGAQSVAEDGSLAIGSASVADVDGNLSTVRLTVLQGNVSVSLAGGASISAGANNSATLTLSGTATQINAALATLAYAPGANYNGGDTLSMLSTDALGRADTDTVAITVTAVNDAPVLTSVGLTVGEGQTVTLAPANIGISDVDSVGFTYTVSGLSGGSFQLSSAPGVAITTFTSAQLSGGQVQFVDDGNETPPTFGLTASDGTASSNTVGASITFTAINDAPVLGAATLTVVEGQTVTLSPGDFNVTDPDSAGFTFTISGLSGGIFQLSGAPGVAITTFTTAQLSAGQVQFVDDGNETPPAFTVSANDGAANSNTMAAAVVFTAANDAPVFTSFGGAASGGVSAAENQSAVAGFGATDIEGDAITFSIVGGADAARFSIDGTTGVLTFASAPDFEAPADVGADNGFDITVQASDGTHAATQSLHVTVTNANEAPTALQMVGGSVVECVPAGTLVASVSAIDPDAGELFSFSLVSDANGRFVIDPTNGRLAVAEGAALDFATATQHTLIVRVTDSGGLSHQQTVVVQVMPIPVPTELPPLTPPSVVSPPAPAPTLAGTTLPADVGAGAAPATEAKPTLRGGGSALPAALEAAPGRTAAVDDGVDTVRGGGQSVARAFKLREGGEDAPFTLSFALFTPEELQGQSVVADEPSLQRSVDALLRQSFGLTRGQAVQIDEPPTPAREQSVTDTLLRAVTDPVKVSSVAFTAGFVWWLTRGGGLLATMLMGIPAWRHIDLAPVLARQLDEEEDDDDEFQLLPTATEPSRLDALSDLRLRHLIDAPSLDSAMHDADAVSAADLFDTPDKRASARASR
ncbi:MAG TPA: cadherin-like domain-containing protein, partial [Burkholderiaceae bacterium]|nr:cadherin-like domain-containing protein [Burkholderiaceae bacterium]